MTPADLEQLKRLLAALREPPPSKESERRAVAAFSRLRPSPGRPTGLPEGDGQRGS